MSESDMRDRKRPRMSLALIRATLLRCLSSSPLFDDDTRRLLYLEFSNSRVMGEQALEGHGVTSQVTRPSHAARDKLPALLSAVFVSSREHVALRFIASAADRCEPFSDRVSVRPRWQYARAGGATAKRGEHPNPPNPHFLIFPRPVRKA
jgi:hypothetical protein